MRIKSKTLTTCHVLDSGAVSLGFVDASGAAATVELPLDQVGALAMTLPALIETALRAQYKDNTLRYAYPLSSWAVESSSDPATGMVTLRTNDGFSVCFSMPRDKQGELSEALASRAALSTSITIN